jgi:hypothetical protein
MQLVPPSSKRNSAVSSSQSAAAISNQQSAGVSSSNQQSAAGSLSPAEPHIHHWGQNLLGHTTALLAVQLQGSRQLVFHSLHSLSGEWVRAEEARDLPLSPCHLLLLMSHSF